MTQNIILNTDSYKASHYKQYPAGAKRVYSYIEARGPKNHPIVFFGLQMFLQQYLSKPITLEDINEAEQVLTLHGLPFNRQGWEYILKTHGGYLPVAINALEEGVVTEAGTPLVLVYNTDPNCAWLTSYLETALLRGVWYPTTVATNSYLAKQTIYRFLQETSDEPEAQIPFKLHDFGARGVSSEESAAIGGLAHLVNFMGTDTLSAIVSARRYYGTGDPAYMPAFSIPAAEHSTITSWGREGEQQAYDNMLTQFPNGLVAVVSDSYNLFEAVETIWGENLKAKIMARDGTLVIRPDSGDPVTIVCKTLEILGAKFGTTLNSKGFKVLDPHVRVIQGDGVDLQAIADILTAMKDKGWSADNLAFGMGGGLLQHLTRDTYKFAMKACAIDINGDVRPVFKDPITDKGKASKRGIQGVFQSGNGLEARSISPQEIDAPTNLLKPAYSLQNNQPIIRTVSLEEVRANTKAKVYCK